jgi:hypothetical protein
VLGRFTHRRAVRGLAAMLRDNLDAKTSVVGLGRKLHAGAVAAKRMGDEGVAAQIAKLGAPEHDARIDALAHAIAPSPARVDVDVVEACRDLAPAAIVETVAFVSVVQLWHRVEAYFGA